MNRIKKGETGPTKQMLSRTLVLMGLCGILAFVVLIAQLFQIQIISHETLEQRALAQQVRATTVTAGRGTIFDASGTVLAKSASVENVFVSPNAIHGFGEDIDLIATGLSRILDVEEELIRQRIDNRGTYYQTIRQMIERDLADEVREFIVEQNLRGIYLEPAMRRYYPRERTASHALGFVGSEQTGMGYGIEGSFDEYLTGTPGRVVRLKTSTGVDMLRPGFENYYTALPGHDLHLTLDVNIQQIMEKHMAQAVHDFDLQGGGFAIAMNPQTGAILGMVSKNDFNPNNHGVLEEELQAQLRAAHSDDDAFRAAVTERLQESWRNKTIQYTYEPGSTFKLVTLAIALEEGIITADSERIFYCGGNVAVPGRVDPVNCWRRTGHGPLNLAQVMQQSCNVGTVELAMEIGADTFFNYLQAFGLFELTGVDLLGESQGQVWSPEIWNRYVSIGNLSSLAAASFGQTFTVSPIRLATSIAALTNGGYIVEPHLVDRVIAADGNVVQEHQPVVRRQVISRETSAAVLDIMERSISDTQWGSGRNAAVPGFRIGGKTGTSTDTVIEALTGEKQYIVSFVSAAPADNPEVVLLVSLQSPGPRNTTYVSGGQMAAPVSGKIWAEILPYLGIPFCNPDEAVLINAQVPHVRRMRVEDARDELETAGFVVEFYGVGTHVEDQLPAAGAMVVAGTRVIVFLDGPRPTDQVAVPDVVGLRYEEARQLLEQSGLFVRRSGTMAQGEAIRVYRQSRDPAEVVTRGMVVEITLIDTSRLSE